MEWIFFFLGKNHDSIESFNLAKLKQNGVQYIDNQ